MCQCDREDQYPIPYRMVEEQLEIMISKYRSRLDRMQELEDLDDGFVRGKLHGFIEALAVVRSEYVLGEIVHRYHDWLTNKGGKSVCDH